MSSLPLEMLRGGGAFARDMRYAPPPFLPVGIQDGDPGVDPAAEAYALGFAEGSAEATESALEAERERDRQRKAIELAFVRFGKDDAETLAERLRQTVIALCEEAVAPCALDMDGLAARISRAIAMLQRAQDERRVLLNPDDLALVKARLPDDLAVESDPAVERGGLRIETPDGGIEDGPAQWQRILREAFGEC